MVEKSALCATLFVTSQRQWMKAKIKSTVTFFMLKPKKQAKKSALQQ
jgi:hypothetical protein